MSAGAPIRRCKYEVMMMNELKKKPKTDEQLAELAKLPENRDVLLTLLQVATWLQKPIGWVYRHVAPTCPPKKRIPAVRLDHGLRFRRADIERWLDANSTCTEASAASAPPDEMASSTSHATRYKG